MKRTKIVATLGPATDSVEKMKALIESGMNAARVNFSHGTYDSHTVLINNLKKAREELNAPIPLILDTKGPEIRIKRFKNNILQNPKYSKFKHRSWCTGKSKFNKFPYFCVFIDKFDYLIFKSIFAVNS